MKKIAFVSLFAVGLVLGACKTPNASSVKDDSSNEGGATSFEAKIRFSLKPDRGSTIAHLNAKLRSLGIANLLPKEIVVDLTQTVEQLLKQKSDLENLVDKASRNEGLDTEPVYQHACFVGDNKQVAKEFGKLADIWVSDQFTISAVATSNPNHVGIRYSETDDGDDVNWLNMDRCD